MIAQPFINGNYAQAEELAIEAYLENFDAECGISSKL